MSLCIPVNLARTILIFHIKDCNIPLFIARIIYQGYIRNVINVCSIGA